MTYGIEIYFLTGIYFYSFLGLFYPTGPLWGNKNY